MRGSVPADGREAVLAVEVIPPPGEPTLRVEAVVDTAFTGHLTLPPATVEAPLAPCSDHLVVGGPKQPLHPGEERPKIAYVKDNFRKL